MELVLAGRQGSDCQILGGNTCQSVGSTNGDVAVCALGNTVNTLAFYKEHGICPFLHSVFNSGGNVVTRKRDFLTIFFVGDSSLIESAVFKLIAGIGSIDFLALKTRTAGNCCTEVIGQRVVVSCSKAHVHIECVSASSNSEALGLAVCTEILHIAYKERGVGQHCTAHGPLSSNGLDRLAATDVAECVFSGSN